MSLGFIRALRLLHRTFRHHPLGQRAHILGRFLTAPFLRTLDVIPAGSRVLDIGAGHGTYPRLIVEERAREVIAVEPDLRKTLLAFRHPRVKFVAGFDDCIRGEFDVIVVYDVIYRLPPEARDALFKRIYDRVKPGGLFVLKDLDPSNRLKWAWNRMQETISDKFFGLTIGEGFYIDTPPQIGERLSRAGFRDFQSKRVDFGYPHAHIIYTARRTNRSTSPNSSRDDTTRTGFP
jgi:SAM-dependent methyltransferase